MKKQRLFSTVRIGWQRDLPVGLDFLPAGLPVRVFLFRLADSLIVSGKFFQHHAGASVQLWQRTRSQTTVDSDWGASS